MSKATFEEERVVKNGNREDWDYFKELLDKHGGCIFWPAETPAGEGCTCGGKGWLEKPASEYIDFDSLGPHHEATCPLYTPF